MKKKSVACLTMAYGVACLPKWISYYSREFGPENVYVVSHGKTSEHDKICYNVNHFSVPRELGPNMEQLRAGFLSNMVNSLLNIYECVIVCDQDELVAINPSVGKSLKDYLLEKDRDVIAPLGFNIIPENFAVKIDWSINLLEQVSSIMFAANFCKPCIRWQPASHGAGNHALRGKSFTVDENLNLFHLKYIDPAAWGKMDEVAKEFQEAGLSENQHLSIWGQGQSWVRENVEKWASGYEAQQEMTPKEAATGRYEVQKMAPNVNAYKVIPLAKPSLVKLPKIYQSIF